MTSIDYFKDILKKHGFKATKGRLAIFEALNRRNQPIGLNTLINSISPLTDRSSIYRNIDILEKIGAINKIYSGWKYRIELSDEFSSHHHHMTCESCGIIHPFELDQKIEETILVSGNKNGFKVKNHEIELRGLCKNCS